MRLSIIFLKILCDPIERSCAVDENGICHALSVLACVTDDLREKIKIFLSATPEEQTKLGTKAYKIGRWLADFVPLLQDPANPFVNKTFYKKAQTDVYAFASLKVIGRQYTINVSVQSLADAFKTLDANCKMVFFFQIQIHLIRLKYEDGLLKVYYSNLPNVDSPDLSWAYANPLDAARYVFLCLPVLIQKVYPTNCQKMPQLMLI